MTHPRRRFKQRSSNAIVRRRTLKKPKEVVDDKIRKVWDKNATLRQNYARLGLATSLNSGRKLAKEAGAVTPISFFSVQDRATGAIEKVPALPAARGARADDMDEDSDAGAPADEEPKPVYDIEALLGFAPGDADKYKSDPRKPSNNQTENMQRLVEKYGKDFKSMSRDLKLNKYQHTPKQLERIYKTCFGELSKN